VDRHTYIKIIIKNNSNHLELMTLLRSRTLSVSSNRRPKTIYEFVRNLENFPRWAKMFCRSIKLLNGEWIAETPQGQAKVRITERNDLGILD
jgi:uncharacterized membrane protein